MEKASGIILGIASALCLNHLALATADGPDHYRVRGIAAGKGLNLRAAPDVASRRIGSIPGDGNCIRNMGCQGGLSFGEFTKFSEAEKRQRLADHPRWCRVEYAGVVGWVAGRYLAEGDCSNR